MRTIKRQNRRSDEPEKDRDGFATASEFDMSVATTPAAWFDAEQESPSDDDGRSLGRRRGMALIPKGRRASPFNVAISALIGSLVTGTGWYWLDTSGLYKGPWVAVAAGIIIALVIRVFSGGVESTFQAALATGIYLLTLAGTLLLITRRELIDIYGSIGDFQLYEDNIIRTRFEEPTQVLAFLLGAAATIVVTYLSRER